MRRLFLAVAIVGLAASQAVAGDYGTIELKTYTRGPVSGNGGQFNWTFDKSGAALPPGWSFAPAINFDANPNTLAAFCLELAQTAGGGVFDINPLTKAPVPGPVMSATQADQINVLATNFMLQVSTNVEAGAFQIAVWEILYGDYDTSTGITNSGINPAGAAAAAGQILIDAVLGGLKAKAGFQAVALTNPNRQDMLTVVTVPEASSLLAFATVAGAIGLVMYRRRK